MQTRQAHRHSPSSLLINCTARLRAIVNRCYPSCHLSSTINKSSLMDGFLSTLSVDCRRDDSRRVLIASLIIWSIQRACINMQIVDGQVETWGWWPNCQPAANCTMLVILRRLFNPARKRSLHVTKSRNLHKKLSASNRKRLECNKRTFQIEQRNRARGSIDARRRQQSINSRNSERGKRHGRNTKEMCRNRVCVRKTLEICHSNQ